MLPVEGAMGMSFKTGLLFQTPQTNVINPYAAGAFQDLTAPNVAPRLEIFTVLFSGIFVELNEVS